MNNQKRDNEKSDFIIPETEVSAMISDLLHVGKEEIRNVTVLKKGMTNRSFLFTWKDRRYIVRIPGAGTEQLINRQEEAEVYQVIKGKDICDEIVYFNAENGCKVTVFFDQARTCDPYSINDTCLCMRKLREFHDMGLQVDHEFDIFRQIEFYERLKKGASVYNDYDRTKKKVLSLQPYIDEHAGKKILSHIDAVPDNFLFINCGEGQENIRLIDWEYAGMQDPHVDIAMFCIYSVYSREQVDRLIDLYFTEGCTHEIRLKIYCYIAACGFLWSNWCEYKRSLGVEFGEYSCYQYRYAKDYCAVVEEEFRRLGMG